MVRLDQELSHPRRVEVVTEIRARVSTDAWEAVQKHLAISHFCGRALHDLHVARALAEVRQTIHRHEHEIFCPGAKLLEKLADVLFNPQLFVQIHHHEHLSVRRRQDPTEALHCPKNVSVVFVAMQRVPVVEDGAASNTFEHLGIHVMADDVPVSRRRTWRQANGIEQRGVQEQLAAVQETPEIVPKAMRDHARGAEDPVERARVPTLPQLFERRRL
mmetsp:Transcript_76574/g.212699  ORF Transcript_76574/g.212699 Transcript_76574/m.212699 type:complete len:217 (+) Transcript_76574:494-1144(+)